MCTAVTLVPLGGNIIRSRTVVSWFHHRIVTTTFHARSYRKYPSLVSPFHKIRTPTSEESNEAQKEKQGETIEWVSVLCTHETLPATTAVLAANAASAAESCSAFKASTSLTIFPNPGIWYVLDLLSLRNKIFSTLLAPNLARSSLTTNFREENALFLVGERRKI